MKIIKKLLPVLALALSIASLGLFVPASNTYADDICSHLPVDSEVYKANGCGGTSTADFSDVLVNILNGLVGVFGIIAVIFIVVGGVNYMTSSGDAGKIKKAKDTILYAVIGLVISALAFAIVNFVVVNILRDNDANDPTTTSNTSTNSTSTNSTNTTNTTSGGGSV